MNDVPSMKKRNYLGRSFISYILPFSAFRSKLVVKASALLIIAFYALSFIVYIFGQYLIPFNPLQISPSIAFLGPSLAHPFGTDNLGVDVFRDVLYSLPLDMVVPLIVVAVALVIGGLVGSIAAFYGGFIDELLMRITDVFRAFPSIVLAVAFAAALGRNAENATISLMVVWWPAYARIARGETLTIKNMDYVNYARVAGVSSGSIITKHIFPNIFQILLTYATVDVGNVLVSFSVLGYLGLGPQPPTPELGRLVFLGQNYITTAPWIALFPALVIFVAVMAFGFLGDGLRDILDPKIRESMQR